VGVGQLIAGLDEGMIGMCINETRRITIPPEKAYGALSSLLPFHPVC